MAEIVARFRSQAEAYNEAANRGYDICFSDGIVSMLSDQDSLVDDLLREVDVLMYEKKLENDTQLRLYREAWYVFGASNPVKAQFETGTTLRLAGHLDGPVETLTEAFDNRQADTVSRGIFIRGAVKRLENSVDARLWNARTTVDDRKMVIGNFNFDFALFGVKDGVANKVAE